MWRQAKIQNPRTSQFIDCSASNLKLHPPIQFFITSLSRSGSLFDAEAVEKLGRLPCHNHQCRRLLQTPRQRAYKVGYDLVKMGSWALQLRL